MDGFPSAGTVNLKSSSDNSKIVSHIIVAQRMETPKQPLSQIPQLFPFASPFVILVQEHSSFWNSLTNIAYYP
jgi:hypothetical protein